MAMAMAVEMVEVMEMDVVSGTVLVMERAILMVVVLAMVRDMVMEVVMVAAVAVLAMASATDLVMGIKND